MRIQLSLNNKVMAFASTLLFLSSCSRNCDTSTPETTAKCMCKLMKEFDEVREDDEKTNELNDKIDLLEAEVEKNIKAGKYTEEEIDAALLKMEDCKK